MIQLVLFDIDGTLIRTGGAGVRAFERTFLLEFGLRDATRGMEFAGRTDPSLARQCFQRHAIPATPENFQRFFDTYVFVLHDLLDQTHGAACLGVADFIRDLQNLSPAPCLGLLTGNIRLGAQIKLRRFDLWHPFSLGAYGDDHENRNELAAIAQVRGRRFLNRELKSDDILVVGDTPRDIECARAIGARMLAVGTGGYSCEELLACAPHWVVPTLQQVRVEAICEPASNALPAGIGMAGNGPASGWASAGH